MRAKNCGAASRCVLCQSKWGKIMSFGVEQASVACDMFIFVSSLLHVANETRERQQKNSSHFFALFSSKSIAVYPLVWWTTLCYLRGCILCTFVIASVNWGVFLLRRATNGAFAREKQEIVSGPRSICGTQCWCQRRIHQRLASHRPSVDNERKPNMTQIDIERIIISPAVLCHRIRLLTLCFKRSEHVNDVSILFKNEIFSC